MILQRGRPIAEEQARGRDEVERIIQTAQTLGIEVDEADVSQWLAAMAASDAMDWEVDEDSGIYSAHRRRRPTPGLAERRDRHQPGRERSPGHYPAVSRDCDYFERVNIKADTRDEACRILADLMRDKALSTFEGPDYDLIEVKFGTWKTEVIKNGEHLPAGAPISWAPIEVQQGRMRVFRPSGEAWDVDWHYGCLDPGWCKMDWVIAEAERGRVVNASNMLDVTWESPDGDIVPLDGFLDPYFQEVYLEAESLPLFTKLSRHVSPRSLDDYVARITREVDKYTHDPANYGKAAKRLYNIFRLTGRHAAAALIRELFDEPAALLYQVWSLMDTIDDAGAPDSAIDRKTLARQTDELIRSVVVCCEGPMESEIVMALLRLRDDIIGWVELGEDRGDLIAESRRKVEKLVNKYFKEKLLSISDARAFIEGLDVRH